MVSVRPGDTPRCPVLGCPTLAGRLSSLVFFTRWTPRSGPSLLLLLSLVESACQRKHARCRPKANETHDQKTPPPLQFIFAKKDVRWVPRCQPNRGIRRHTHTNISGIPREPQALTIAALYPRFFSSVLVPGVAAAAAPTAGVVGATCPCLGKPVSALPNVLAFLTWLCGAVVGLPGRLFVAARIAAALGRAPVTESGMLGMSGLMVF